MAAVVSSEDFNNIQLLLKVQHRHFMSFELKPRLLFDLSEGEVNVLITNGRYTQLNVLSEQHLCESSVCAAKYYKSALILLLFVLQMFQVI